MIDSARVPVNNKIGNRSSICTSIVSTTGIVSTSTGTESTSTGTVLTSTGTVSTSTGTVLTSTGTVPLYWFSCTAVECR